MAKLYAIAIRDGKMTIDEVPLLWRAATRRTYFAKYGEELM